jgi:tetratricopeptide (TPR) repeat protein
MVVADYVSVEITLSSKANRLTILTCAILVSASFAFHAAKYWWADRRLDSQSLPSMERGVAMVPGDADAWDRLGRYRQWSFTDPDPTAAIADFQHAVQVDPLSANYWMDLATAYEIAGDAAKARAAYEKAKSDYPISAQVEWNYGNFLLRQQEFEPGYQEIQKAVRGDSTLMPLAISRVWRSSQDVQNLLDNVLPPGVDAYFQALDFFQSNRLMDPALAVWQRLLSLGKPFALSRAFPLLEELIREDRADDVRRVWQQALEASGKPAAVAANGSLMWNGDFTQDFLNGGLGWRWDPPLGVADSFERAPMNLPGRSLRLDFGGGTNLQLQMPAQYVPVESNRAYHFHAYIRSEGITTESGPRFGIEDPHHPAELNLFTPNMTGSNPWQAVDLDLTTTADTRFLLIYLYRPPSRLFDNKLSGTVWIADTTLTPNDSTGRPHS